MKVLFIQNIEGIGGSENYLIRLLPGLKKAGIHCEMVSVIPNFRRGDQGSTETFRQLLEKEGIRVHQIRTSSYKSPTLIFKLRKIVSQGEFELVHTHLIYADFWAACMKLLPGKSFKIVSTKHGYQEKIYSGYSLNPAAIPRNLYYNIFRFSECFIDLSYACSHSLSDFLKEAGLVKKMAVVEHGFEYPPIGDSLAEFRFYEKQLVLPGRLIYRKGHDIFFDIFSELITLFPKLGAVIIGDGADRESIHALVEERGLEEHVLFKGYQDNPLDWMAASDVVVVPSRSEGLPLVIMEAFQSGTPVVAFDVPGCRDAIENGKTGLIVPAFDLQGFSEAIAQLLRDKTFADELAANAKMALAARFSFKRMVEETIAVYRSAGRA